MKNDRFFYLSKINSSEMVGLDWNRRDSGYERLRNPPRNVRTRANHEIVRTYVQNDDPLFIGHSNELFTTTNIQLDGFQLHCKWFLDEETLQFKVKMTLKYKCKNGYKGKAHYQFHYDREGQNVVAATDALTANTPLNFMDQVRILDHLRLSAIEFAEHILEQFGED